MPAPEPLPDLLKAVNDASSKAFALWITFLSVMVFLAISIGTTTPRELLLGTPIKLPLLGVDLPLPVFYVFAPMMLAVLHLYLLIQLAFLFRLLVLFFTRLRQAKLSSADEEIVSSQLDGFVVTQFLLGRLVNRDLRMYQPGDWHLAIILGFAIWYFQSSVRNMRAHTRARVRVAVSKWAERATPSV